MLRHAPVVSRIVRVVPVVTLQPVIGNGDLHARMTRETVTANLDHALTNVSLGIGGLACDDDISFFYLVVKELVEELIDDED